MVKLSWFELLLCQPHHYHYHGHQAGWSALLSAAANGFESIVYLLVKAGAKTELLNKVGGAEILPPSLNILTLSDVRGHYLVHRAARCSLFSTPNINHAIQEGMSALSLVATNGRHRLVRFLVTKGAAVNHANEVSPRMMGQR